MTKINGNGWTKNISLAVVITVVILLGQWIWYGRGVCKDVEANTLNIAENNDLIKQVVPRVAECEKTDVRREEQYKSIGTNQARIESKVDSVDDKVDGLRDEFYALRTQIIEAMKTSNNR